MAISIVVSNRVLTRLEETQARNLQQLASAYLDGLSASLIPSVVREDVWEVFDTLDRSRQRYRGLNVQWVAVTDSDGIVIAASDPQRFPSLSPLPQDTSAAFAGVKEIEIAEHAGLMRPLFYQDRDIGRIYAEANVSALMRERSDVLWELILTNVLLTLLLVAFGYTFMRRMLKPVSLLSSHLTGGIRGKMEPISADTIQSQSRELKEAMDARAGATRAELVDAIVGAIKAGGLFSVNVDIIHSQIGQAAHVILPAVESGEMNLTSMNGERRMRLVEKYMDGPGSAKPDCLIAGPGAAPRKSIARGRSQRLRRPVQGLRLGYGRRRLHGWLSRQYRQDRHL